MKIKNGCAFINYLALKLSYRNETLKENKLWIIDAMRPEIRPQCWCYNFQCCYSLMGSEVSI